MSLKLENTGNIIFHISKDVTLTERTFTPRVPSLVTKGENLKTKRICFSTSIEGALSAIPNKGDIASQTTCNRPYYLSVFKTKLNDVKHLTTEDILSDVPDAHLTNECWVMEDVTLKPEMIKVTHLTLSFYNKYTAKYSGTTKELVFERQVKEKDREETVKFIGRHFIRRAIKWANEMGVNYEVLSKELTRLRHRRFNLDDEGAYRGTTKTYQVKEVKFIVPSGVDISGLWFICYEQTKFLYKHNLTDRAFVVQEYDEDWFLYYQDELEAC